MIVFFGFQNCVIDDKCAMHDKWTLVRENMINVLNSTSLAELNGTKPHSFFK